MRILTLLFRRETAVPVVALTFASGVSVALLLARIAWTWKFHYAFLIWNLFLAWLPLIFALLACERYRNGFRRDWPFFGFTTAWLLFFPNAPYIFTDLIHLTTRYYSHFWVDLVLILSCALTGLVLGFVSLYLMQCIVIKTFGRFASWFFIALVAGLSSFGIYIGRFVRLNSWDILQNPTETAQEILGIVIDPSRRLAAFTLLYTFFFLFVFLLLYSFSHMLREQTSKTQDPSAQPASSQHLNANQ